MRSNTVLNAIVKTAALAGVLLAPGVSYAADVYLQTESYSKSLPGAGAGVPMWRFVCDGAAATAASADNASCSQPSSGSAQINVAAGEALTVHLNNTLPTPVSLIVPGQLGGGAGAPVMAGGRVQSFAPEAAATTGTATYSWTSVRPGTYLYQSGTHPSIQVPMGLHGALVVGPTAATCTSGQAAYDSATSCYNDEVVMLFSEVDPAQNAAVIAAGGVIANYPSTINYNPAYLLVNGEVSADLSGISNTADSTVLLRMLNAGSRSHTPAIVGTNMLLIAEDGNLYPGLPLEQAQALLPAGKTLDALMTAPGADVTFGLYDRTPDFTNSALPEGGMVANIIVNAGTPPPPAATTYAVNDSYSVTEDTVYPGASVLVNDVGLAGATVSVVTSTANGTLVMNTDGSFTYTPDLNFSGTDGFTYSANDGSNSYGASVALNVSFLNDAPVANPDGPYVNTVGSSLTVDAMHGVLGNDTDPDGDALTAVLDGTAPTGLILNADGSFTYTGTTAATFSYHANDGVSDSATATVSLDYFSPSNITLNVIDSDGDAVTAYRWLVQEDRTYRIDPNNPTATPLIEQQFLNFHRSSMPPVAQGCTDCDPESIAFNQVALDPTKHYYVSVLPNDATQRSDPDGFGVGHTIGGAQIAPGQSAVTVIVNKQEIPTAQISVQIFEDLAPTNGVPDANEPGLGGFQVVLEDAGGRYGISGGTMSQDAFGNPLTNSLPCAPPATPGVILSCPDGSVLIENLPPGKYGVIGVAPAGAAQWIQTSTIEGTKVIDAWVKAGEPPFMLEFGGPGPHAFIGFVNPTHTCVGPAPCQVAESNPPAPGSSTVTGHVTLAHDPRPPGVPGTIDSGSYAGLSHTRAWIGLNTIAGDGPSIATVQADADGNFTLTDIPDGTYQLVIWDTYLDQVISFETVTLPAQAGDIGNISVPAWFTRAEHNVFLDTNGNGVRDANEAPLAEQAVNLRWRDGTVNQSFPTDLEGFVPFDQVFPFFSWQVFEVDYTRFKATGVTVTVDAGGDVTTGPYPGLLYPQEGSPRTETGPVLTQGFQGFPGQTSIFEWGKAPYAPGENGGISGIVFYGSTRGESDPRFTVGDPWEPGIADVTVRLYREIARNPDQVDTNVGSLDFPVVEEGDIDLNGNGVYDGPTVLTLVQETTTDSWDVTPPTGCPGEDPLDPYTTDTLLASGAPIDKCYDGWRNWNQVRPGVFDGGYAFNDIPPGTYVVEVVTPQGYELIKEEDVNVGFGDAFGPNVNGFAPVAVTLPNGMLVLVVPDQAMIAAAKGPEPGIAQPACVGLYHQVPDELRLFSGEAAPFAGDYRPLCDRKRVVLSDQGQAAADFHLFTTTPVATQYAGLITDDISNETNPASPGFGEKWSPAYLPFSIRDFKGREVYRGYSDAFGRYNGLAPSTFTANIPIPSGYSPAMLAACLNDPGDGPQIDPLHLPTYGNSCYTMQFMPGTTTYLDTPILPTAGFAAGFNPPDCAAPARTPVISTVDGGSGGPLVASGGTLTISSHGDAVIPNPDYEGPLNPAIPATITRDLGFGSGGTVTLGGFALTPTAWTNTEITVPVAGTPSGEYQLVVTRDTGETSINTVTVTVGGTAAATVTAGGSIQAAVDAAAAGDLILVGPGVYEELVVISKPVRLQGSGADTVINATKRPTDKLQLWLDKVGGLFASGAVDPLPGQTDFTLATEQGAGITVLAKNDGSWDANASRIDGFTITGADVGGGIFVNGYADNLEISNNNIAANSGFRSGGIRVGHPFLPLVGGGPFAFNTNLKIHHNAVTANGATSFESAGGGISLNTGSDNYVVSKNFVCGNYTPGDGGGIGHLGLSDNGLIQYNKVLFNQSLNNSFNQHGGGIVVAGEPAAAPALTLGTGDVTIDGNLIQGNHAASGHGGGIRAQLVNGVDVQLAGNGPSARANWHKLAISNNMIVNNVAGWSGAGIGLQDAVNTAITLNTIAYNDSTATVGGVLNGAGVSTPQPAGISSERNSIGLDAVIPGGGNAPKNFSNAQLTHNILWHNRAFYFDGAILQPNLVPTAAGECAGGAVYRDLGVLDPIFVFRPLQSILTDVTGYDISNVSADPLFLSEYCNGGRGLSNPGPMLATAAFAEGGNFVDVRYGPLTGSWPEGGAPWNYHIAALSPAVDFAAGVGNAPSVGGDHDFDGDARPVNGNAYDIGADEIGGGPVTPPPPPPPPVGPSMVAFSLATLGTLDATAGTLSFGNLANGTYASDVTIAVTGDSAVTFGTLVMDGGNGARYELGNDSCSGQTIGPNFVCTVTINFNANGNVVRTGSLTIPHNATVTPTPLVLQLSGQ